MLLPPLVILTWSDVNVSAAPFVYVMEYLSASNGSKYALEIPALISNPSPLVNSNTPAAVDALLFIWRLIIRLEFEVSTVETLGLGILAKRPESRNPIILGDLILNVEVVLMPADKTDPSLTPATGCVAAKVKVVPSGDITETLLNTTSSLSPLWYAIIESVLIPTWPENLLFGDFAVVAVTFNWSLAWKFGKIRS